MRVKCTVTVICALHGWNEIAMRVKCSVTVIKASGDAYLINPP